MGLDDWQKLVLVESAWTQKPARRGARPKWSASSVGVEVARQNGKGDIKIVRQLTALFVWRQPLQTHTAHLYPTCYEHFRKLVDIVENVPAFTKLLHPRRGVTSGSQNQAIELRTGERIKFIARSGGSGRGMTGHTVYLDEAFDLTSTQMGALQYTLRAVRDPQIWFTSSAPHAHSLVLHNLHDRALLSTDEEPRLFYAAWNNDPTVDEGDPEAWFRANPALGVRVSVDTMAEEYRSAQGSAELMAEFRREALSIPEKSGASYDVIPESVWRDVCGDFAPTGRVFLALDVNPERDAAAIAAVGGGVLEVVDHRPGTGWLVDRVAEVAKRQKAKVAVDTSGPAASFVPELERRGVRVEPLNSTDMAKAASRFYDDVADGKIKVRSHAGLDAAVAGAAKAPSGDAWRWGRKNTQVDVSPLVAGTAAYWCATNAPTASLFVAVT